MSSEDLLTELEIEQHETGKVGNKAKVKVDPKRTYTIIIDEVEDLPSHEFVGVNGKGYQIKRGEPVEVPAEVVEALKNAVTTAYRKQPHPTEPGRQILVPYQKSSVPWRLA